MPLQQDHAQIEAQYTRIRQQFPKFDELIDTYDYSHFDTLISDLWQALYSGETTLIEENSVNYVLLQQLFHSEAFQKLSGNAKGNLLLATLTTWRFSYVTGEWLKKMTDEQTPADVDEQTGGSEEELDYEASSNSSGAGSDTLSPAELATLFGDAEALAAWQDMLDEELQEVEEVSSNVDELLRGLAPSVGAGDAGKVPIQEQLALAAELAKNPELQKIAEWAGRFKLKARNARKTKQVRTILKQGMTTGNAAERLLPIEYLKSEAAESKLDFMHRFAEGRTLMYDYKKRTKKGKGAFVVCYDESGSMQELDVEGKGFVLALLAIAKKEKRDFVFIPFSGDVGYSDVKVFKKGRYSVRDMLDVAASYIGGGTNFEAPLREAMQHLEKSAKDGDIVFITDGMCHISDDFIAEFNALKDKKQFEMLSLLVGYNKHEGLLPAVSEMVLKIHDFEDEQGAVAFTL